MAHTHRTRKNTMSSMKNARVITCRAKLPVPYGKLCKSDEHAPVAITTECHCQENRLGFRVSKYAISMNDRHTVFSLSI